MCAQRLDPTKPVAVLGDMAVIEAGLARIVLIWGDPCCPTGHISVSTEPEDWTLQRLREAKPHILFS